MNPMRSLVEGAAGGAVGTAVMSVLMAPDAEAGRRSERPPLRIVRHLLPAAVLRRTRGGRPLAMVGHIGYGCGAGALFGVLVRTPPPLWAGVAYGVALWLAGYEGWVPAMGAMPPAHRDDPERAWRVGAAHLSYGTALSVVLRALRRP